MKKQFSEFKDFIMKGNVIDLAIGIIIGSAFGTIVNSVVENLLMPPLGLLFGDVDFADLYIILKQGAEKLSKGATLQMARDAGPTGCGRSRCFLARADTCEQFVIHEFIGAGKDAGHRGRHGTVDVDGDLGDLLLPNEETEQSLPRIFWNLS